MKNRSTENNCCLHLCCIHICVCDRVSKIVCVEVKGELVISVHFFQQVGARD